MSKLQPSWAVYNCWAKNIEFLLIHLADPRSQSLHGVSPRVTAKVSMALKFEVLPDESFWNSTDTLPCHFSCYDTIGSAKSLVSQCEAPLTSCQDLEKVGMFLQSEVLLPTCIWWRLLQHSLNMSRFHQALLVLSSAKRSSNGPPAETLKPVKWYENILIFSLQTKRQNWIFTWHFVDQRNKRNSRVVPGCTLAACLATRVPLSSS